MENSVYRVSPSNSYSYYNSWVCTKCIDEVFKPSETDGYLICPKCSLQTKPSSPKDEKDSNATVIPNDSLDILNDDILSDEGNVHNATSQGATSQVSESLCFGESQNSQEQSQDDRSYQVPLSKKQKIDNESQHLCDYCDKEIPVHKQACTDCLYTDVV
jgi:uncharacterized Zn finger protein (UPF0148 family)